MSGGREHDPRANESEALRRTAGDSSARKAGGGCQQNREAGDWDCVGDIRGSERVLDHRHLAGQVRVLWTGHAWPFRQLPNDRHHHCRYGGPRRVTPLTLLSLHPIDCHSQSPLLSPSPWAECAPTIIWSSTWPTAKPWVEPITSAPTKQEHSLSIK